MYTSRKFGNNPTIAKRPLWPPQTTNEKSQGIWLRHRKARHPHHTSLPTFTTQAKAHKKPVWEKRSQEEEVRPFFFQNT